MGEGKQQNFPPPPPPHPNIHVNYHGRGREGNKQKNLHQGPLHWNSHITVKMKGRGYNHQTDFKSIPTKKLKFPCFVLIGWCLKLFSNSPESTLHKFPASRGLVFSPGIWQEGKKTSYRYSRNYYIKLNFSCCNFHSRSGGLNV